MKTWTKIALVLTTVGTVGIAAGIAQAHPYGYGPGCGGEGGPGMGYGPGPGPMGMGPGGRGFGPGAGGAFAEQRLAWLKSELKITASQEPAWTAYADQIKQQADAMQASRAAMQGGAQASAPERMELRNQLMKQRQAQLDKATAAFKDLYAALAPDQKAIADRQMAPGYGPGRGGPGRHWQ
jgi:hypothetical protein